MDKKFGPQVELEPAALKSQKSDEILSKALPHYIRCSENSVATFVNSQLCIMNMEHHLDATQIRLEIYKSYIL